MRLVSHQQLGSQSSYSGRLLFGLSQKWKSKAQCSLNTTQVIKPDVGPGPD